VDELAQALREIETARDLSAIEATVRRMAKPFGYDSFVLFSASTALDDLVEHIYWVEGDWFGDQSNVDAETYVRHCPVTRHILETDEPFFWTKTQAPSGEKYRVVKIPRGSGIHGLQVPVFGHAGLEGAISFGGRNIDSSLIARATLALAGTAAFRAARRLTDLRNGAVKESLSAREREVLQWTAAGRRQIDIAATLGLSERTIENHLRRARERLGAQTTAQAIRIAIRNGEMGE